MPCRIGGAAAWSARLEPVVFLGGRFVEAAEARVSLLDRGYLLGEGAFATLRAYRGRCFRAERHLAQLALAADAFGLRLPDDARANIDESARRVGDARVRVTISDTAFSILAEPIAPPHDDEYARGVHVITVPARRVSAMKTLSYAPSMLAQREARARGAAEAILLAPDGSLASGSVSNLFVIRGDELATPALASGCRPGITREAILELAPRLGLRAAERRIAPDEIFDEAFLTSSRIEVLPIATFDDRRLAGNERAHALHRAFRELVELELELAPR